jgi:hypothetical protein
MGPMTRLSRRSLVGALGGSAADVALLGSCGLGTLGTSRTDRVHRIGALLPNSRAANRVPWDAFVDQLRASGWVECQNLTIEWRAADNQVDQLPDLAADLVRLPVELMVTDGAQASFAAKHATSTIPIVFFGGDPVETGLVSEPGPSRRQHHGARALFNCRSSPRRRNCSATWWAASPIWRSSGTPQIYRRPVCGGSASSSDARAPGTGGARADSR